MLAVKNEEMREAVDLLRRLSAKNKARWEYEAREKAWRDERARERFAENKGRTEILDLPRGGASAEDILRKYGG